MVDNKRFQKIKKFIFKNSRADDVQVLYTSSVSYLTRLANSYIHQNVHENTETLIVNSIFGKKIGVATTRDLSEKNIIKTIRIAEAIAKNRPEDPDYPGLPLGAEIFYTDKFNEKSSGTTPQQRANILKDIVKICNKSGVNASGYVSTDFSNFAVATTKGADCFCALSNAHLFIITDKGFATGFAEDENIDFFKLNHEKVAKIAVEKCLKSVDPISVEPGDYTVILEEPAVGEMLAYFNYIAFNTKSYYEGRSALSGKLGKQVAGKNITIVENWKHPKGQGMPF
ncbi:MAG: metallopeptidase TldD-related protein, partial [bacterium]|nr:metallopeptidase TldD-related protein [bacterium]